MVSFAQQSDRHDQQKRLHSGLRAAGAVSALPLTGDKPISLTDFKNIQGAQRDLESIFALPSKDGNPHSSAPFAQRSMTPGIGRIGASQILSAAVVAGVGAALGPAAGWVAGSLAFGSDAATTWSAMNRMTAAHRGGGGVSRPAKMVPLAVARSAKDTSFAAESDRARGNNVAQGQAGGKSAKPLMGRHDYMAAAHPVHPLQAETPIALKQESAAKALLDVDRKQAVLAGMMHRHVMNGANPEVLSPDQWADMEYKNKKDIVDHHGYATLAQTIGAIDARYVVGSHEPRPAARIALTRGPSFH